MTSTLSIDRSATMLRTHPDRPPLYDAASRQLDATWSRIIRVLPVIGIVGFSIIVAIPFTRRGAYWLVAENRPVEMLTFFAALAAAAQGIRLIRAHWRGRSPRWTIAFFFVFTLGLLLVAGEEIAWGQQFFRFQTPEPIARLNQQGELTLHNLGPMQGRNDFLRSAFGIGGLVGLWLGRRYAMLRPITPPTILFNWFALIVVVGLVDTFCDASGMTARGWEFSHRMSEVVEMYIAISAFLFVLLRSRELPRPEHASSTASAVAAA